MPQGFSHTFADRMQHVHPSGIREVFKLAAKIKDPVNFSIGQADFDVPGPIKDLAMRAIAEGRNKYTQTDGLPELKQAVQAYLERHYQVRDRAVMVTSGVSGGLMLAMQCLINPGDEVLIPDPHFMMYSILLNLCGGAPVFYDTYPDFHPRPVEIEKKITPRTKILMINSPSNPTGAMYTEAELRALAEIARRHNLLVISDEIYERFRYGVPHVSIASFHENTLLVGGFSKTFAMPGWRVGYAVGAPELIDRMCTLQQFSFVCAPAPFQKACAMAIDFDMTPYIEEYRRKRDLVYEGLKDRFEIAKPDGAFYFFPRVPWGTDKEFVTAAIAEECLIIPGSAFSARDTHFRLSFAVDDDHLLRGIDILNRLARRGPAAVR